MRYSEILAESTSINGLTVMSLEDFVGEPLEEDYDPFLGATARPFSDDEMKSFMSRRVSGDRDSAEGKRDRFDRPYLHKSNVKIVDDAGQEFDLDALRKDITARPSKLLKQNEKMVHSGKTYAYYNIGLPALKGLAVNEKTGQFVIVDTCPSAGACKLYCYAMKGSYVQFKAVSMGATRTLNYLMNDPNGFANQLDAEIKKVSKKDVQTVIRWHDAGDFFSPQYLELAFDIARRHPNVMFYAYTKSAAAAQADRPENFLINFSMGALPKDEKQIDYQETKHSRVVGKDLFSDLLVQDGRTYVRDEKGRMIFSDMDAVKQRIADKYNLDVNTVLWYDEFENVKREGPARWNVIVRPGDGDEPANTPSVLGTYLIIH